MKSNFRIIIFIITYILFNSCLVGSKSEKGIDCRKVINFLNETWIYDAKNDIYQMDKKNIKFFIEHKDCLYGKTKDEVIMLLGKPNIVINESLVFYMDTKCNAKPQKFCTLITISLDKNTQKVFEVTSGGYFNAS